MLLSIIQKWHVLLCSDSTFEQLVEIEVNQDIYLFMIKNTDVDHLAIEIVFGFSKSGLSIKGHSKESQETKTT